MFLRIVTGRVTLGEEKRIKLATKRVSGEVEKVLVKYGEDCSPQLRVRMYTPSSELFLDVTKQREFDIYYPRNMNVLSQRYDSASSLIQHNGEKWTCLGSILIIIESSVKTDCVDNIGIVIRGESMESTLDLVNLEYSPLREDIGKAVRKMHSEVIAEIEKEEGVNIIQKAEDQQELVDKISDALFNRKFEKLTAQQSEEVKRIIAKYTIQGKGMDSMVKAIQRKIGKTTLTRGEIDRITRTEVHEARTVLREDSYNQLDPAGEWRYKWTGPQDNRTTEVCEEIKARTRSGVPLLQLKSIVHEIGRKHGFDPREWTPHYNCRHSFRRVSA